MRTTAFLSVLTIFAFLTSGCIVSKKEYLLKADEADACARNLKVKADETALLKGELSQSQADLAASQKRVEELEGKVNTLSTDRQDLLNRLNTANAVNDELKGQNDKLSGLLESKEVSQSQVIKETMEINKKLQETNASLREQLAARDAAVAERDRLAAQVSQLQAQINDLNRRKDEELSRLKGAYDELVGNLKSEIEAGEVQVRQLKDRLTVNMVEKILFDTGKAEIKPTGLEVLAKVGTELAKIGNRRIQIEGHTDNVPITGKLKTVFPTNWELSAARALAVVRFLQDKVGIDPANLSAAGYGEYQPAAGNDTPEGKAANRRIEIVLLTPYEKAAEAQQSTSPPQ